MSHAKKHSSFVAKQNLSNFKTKVIRMKEKLDAPKNRLHLTNAHSRVLTLLSSTNRTQGDTRRDREFITHSIFAYNICCKIKLSILYRNIVY